MARSLLYVLHMKIKQVVALSTVAMFATLGGCASKASSTSDGSLDTSEQQLTGDNTDSQEAEDGAEDGVENGLSGATAADPGTPADGVDLVAIDAKIKLNPGLYFQPAGCVVSTRLAAGQWSHVFTNCTGPGGRVTYNGTVKSTWTIAAGALSVNHEASGFSVKGPNVTVSMSGSRQVDYTRSGTVITKHRVGDWMGTLAKNAAPTSTLPWSHHADFTSTWDPTSKCFTHDGSAENAVGGRTFGRTVTAFKVCGGLFACPSGGEFVVERKDGTAKLTITFLGGQDVDITGPRGNTFKTKLFCIAK